MNDFKRDRKPREESAPTIKAEPPMEKTKTEQAAIGHAERLGLSASEWDRLSMTLMETAVKAEQISAATIGASYAILSMSNGTVVQIKLR